MRLILTLALSVALAGPALAKPPLRDVAEIDNALMMIAIANEIREECDGIDARMIRAWSTINDLRARARALGYTDAEIDAYTGSKSEKKRMRAKAEGWLRTQGVDAAKTPELCAFGQGEIAKGSAIGRLLH